MHKFIILNDDYILQTRNYEKSNNIASHINSIKQQLR